jgi:hypothetical protein
MGRNNTHASISGKSIPLLTTDARDAVDVTEPIPTENIVPMAPYIKGRGGLLLEDGYVSAISRADGVLATAPLGGMDPYDIIDRYGAADIFPDLVWCIGEPFDRILTVEVTWRQNGIDCGGEVMVEGINKAGEPIPFSWEIVVSYNATLFSLLPGYEVDVAFPVDAFHDRRDIVLRRRIARFLLDMCVGPVPGSFKVHKRDRQLFRVTNPFRLRPTPKNTPVLAGMGLDIHEARKQGARY